MIARSQRGHRSTSHFGDFGSGVMGVPRHDGRFRDHGNTRGAPMATDPIQEAVLAALGRPLPPFGSRVACSRSPISVFTIPTPAFTMSDAGVYIVPICVFTFDRSGRSPSAGTRGYKRGRPHDGGDLACRRRASANLLAAERRGSR